MRRMIIYGGLLAVLAIATPQWLGLLDPASGPALGEFTSAFYVRDVTGPMSGGSLCYR